MEPGEEREGQVHVEVRLGTEAEPTGQSTKAEQETRVKPTEQGARYQDRAVRARTHRGGADGTGAHQGGADGTGAHQGGADGTGAHQGGAEDLHGRAEDHQT